MNNFKKIYDLEVTPPSGAWKAIAQQLDAYKTEKTISQKLNDFEITPPPNAWQFIADHLDGANQELHLSEKLYNSEVSPPSFIWDNISRELDDQKALEIIEKKLSHMQVQPPAGTWPNIKNALDEKQKPAMVVPMHHGWLKYAAAACFIAIVSITAYFILNDGGNTSYKAYTANGRANDMPVAIAQPVISKNKNTTIPEANKQALAGIRTKLGNAYITSNEKNAELQNRYIILMTPEGNIVRMSKKVGNMADCIAGEDHSCDDQISKWQKKMASNATTATPDNFLGLLDIAYDEAQN